MDAEFVERVKDLRAQDPDRWTYSELAKEFGVCKQTINRVFNGRPRMFRKREVDTEVSNTLVVWCQCTRCHGQEHAYVSLDESGKPVGIYGGFVRKHERDCGEGCVEAIGEPFPERFMIGGDDLGLPQHRNKDGIVSTGKIRRR